MDPNAPWPELQGGRLVLRPTTMEDAPALWPTVEVDTFAYALVPVDFTPDGFAAYLAKLLQAPNQRTYTMWHGSEAVGCSSFLDIRPHHRGVEIGHTWIGKAWRGTFVNPEAKRLMLGYAFERLGCVRVQLKCDARNERSAAAIGKLGAVFEGRLRRHMILPDGFVRDTLMFSVTDAEWLSVRDRLEKRIVG